MLRLVEGQGLERVEEPVREPLQLGRRLQLVLVVLAWALLVACRVHRYLN